MFILVETREFANRKVGTRVQRKMTAVADISLSSAPTSPNFSKHDYLENTGVV